MPTWTDFARALTGVLAGFADGERLIILAVEPAGVYVQAAQDDEDLVVEGVADEFLPVGSRVGEAGAAQLRLLGFAPPEFKYENWSHRVGWPAPTAEYRDAAEILVRALRDVYRVAATSQLSYRAWNDRRDPSEMDYPELGLPPATTSG